MGPPADERLVAIVDRERMQAWMEAAASMGVDPDAVTPDHLLLPEPEPDDPALAVHVGEALAVRGARLALTTDAELLPLVMGERAYREIQDRQDAEHLFAIGATRPLFDLRQGAFGRAGERGANRPSRLALLAAAVGLLVLAPPAVTAVRHSLAAREAMAEAERLAGPSSGETVAPAARLRQRLARIRAGERFPTSAAAVFAAIEGVEGMELQSLLYGDDGAFRASVRHMNYSDVESLRAGLTRAGMTVEESSAVPEQGRILSGLVVRPRP